MDIRRFIPFSFILCMIGNIHDTDFNEINTARRQSQKGMKFCYLQTEGSLRSRVSLTQSDSMNGKTGYCMRSLKDRPACLFKCVKYSKLVICPVYHKFVRAVMLPYSRRLGRLLVRILWYTSSRTYKGGERKQPDLIFRLSDTFLQRIHDTIGVVLISSSTTRPLAR